MFRQALDNNPNFRGLNIKFAIQHIPKGRYKPYGTADALHQCIIQYPKLRESTFCVCNSDNPLLVRCLNRISKNCNSRQAILAYDIDGVKLS